MNEWNFFEKAWAILVGRLSSFLPTVLATLVVLAVGWLVSFLLAGLARRLLSRTGFDGWIERSELSEGARSGFLGAAPSRLVARLVFWLFFLCFVVIAMENLGLDLSELPIRAFIGYLPVVLGAILLLVGGVVVAALLGRGTSGLLESMGIEHGARLGRMVKGLVIALTVVLVIEQLGFDVTTLTQTFSNLIIVIAAGLVFAFAWGGREVARNVLAGYYIREQFRRGDRLTVDGLEGRLEEIGSLNTRLSTGDGDLVVPNCRLIEQTVARKRSG